LRSFEHIQIVGLVFELKVSLHDEPQKNGKETDVVDKENHREK
jgi:hypothetical protein